MKISNAENLNVKKNWSSGGNSSVPDKLRHTAVFQSVIMNLGREVTEIKSLRFLQIQLFTAASDVSCNLGKFCSIQDLHGYTYSDVNIQKHTLSLPIFANTWIP